MRAWWMVRQNPQQMILAGIISIFFAVGCRNCEQDPVKPTVLVILDLSSSIDPRERLHIPDIAIGIISKQEPGTRYAVYGLDTDMESNGSLSSGVVPDIGDTGSEKIKFAQERARQQTRLKADIEKTVSLALATAKTKPRYFTSCYIGSMAFATKYFSDEEDSNVPHPRKVFWIGDLIEDCPDGTYGRMKLPPVAGKSEQQLAKLDISPNEGRLRGLRDVELWTITIPRQFGDDPHPEISPTKVEAYWRVMLPRLVGSEKVMRAIPADQFGIQAAP